MRLPLVMTGLVLLASCAAEPPVDAPRSNDVRGLLTREALSALNRIDPARPEEIDALCAVETYQAPVATIAPYRNETYGVEMHLPYNPEWGTRQHVVPPYYELPEEQTVLFGPLEHGEGCVLVRHWEMKILPPRTAVEARDAAREWLTQGTGLAEPPATLAPKIGTIEGKQVVEYVDVGLCSYPTIEVVGQKYNYKIAYCAGGEDRDKDLGRIRAIVRTMKFL